MLFVYRGPLSQTEQLGSSIIILRVFQYLQGEL